MPNSVQIVIAIFLIVLLLVKILTMVTNKLGFTKFGGYLVILIVPLVLIFIFDIILKLI
jgi:hypothetical protein